MLILYFITAGENINNVFIRNTCSNCANEPAVKPFSSCPAIFSAVCGTNNVTYSNECEFANAQCSSGGTIYRQPNIFCDGMFIVLDSISFFIDNHY